MDKIILLCRLNKKSCAFKNVCRIFFPLPHAYALNEGKRAHFVQKFIFM